MSIAWRTDNPAEATHAIGTLRIGDVDIVKPVSWFRGSWRDPGLHPLPKAWTVRAWAPWPDPYVEAPPFDLEAECSLARFLVESRINANHAEARTAVAERGLREAEQVANRVHLEFARIGFEHDLPLMARYSAQQLISLRVFLGLNPISMEHCR